MSAVLIGQAYYLRFDPKLWDARQPYPPLGPLYAAGYLRTRGHDVAVFDAMLATSEREWALRLDRERPRVAVIYEDSFNYLSKMCLGRMRQAAIAMIRMAKDRGCAVAVAGSDATDDPEAYLEAGADAVIVGEGEVTLQELTDAFTGRPPGPLGGIPGLCFRDARGRTVRTPPRPVVRDLDALPLPAWDLVEVGSYRRIWRERHGYFSMNLATTRGCPYHCNWCAKPIYGQRYTVRSPENVVEEIEWLKTEHAPDHLNFVDDIFGLKPGWVERFAELVTARGLVTPFKCLSRVDLLTGLVVEALEAAGCRTVWVGAESGSQKILDAMEKGTTVEQIATAARRLKAAGIEVGFFLQFGYPGETREDIERTLQMVRDCRPDDIGISVSYPLPGTPFHERVKAELGAKRHWVDSGDLAMMYRGPFSTEFYRSLYHVVHKEFRLSRLRGAVATRNGRRSGRLRRTAVALYHAATLPLERRRLERLARARHQGIGPLTAAISPERAARPSDQDAVGEAP
jgi:anaerobic magnesium-protoporphyrin IX monomethyl ester cyclase